MAPTATRPWRSAQASLRLAQVAQRVLVVLPGLRALLVLAVLPGLRALLALLVLLGRRVLAVLAVLLALVVLLGRRGPVGLQAPAVPVALLGRRGPRGHRAPLGLLGLLGRRALREHAQSSTNSMVPVVSTPRFASIVTASNVSEATVHLRVMIPTAMRLWRSAHFSPQQTPLLLLRWRPGRQAPVAPVAPVVPVAPREQVPPQGLLERRGPAQISTSLMALVV